MQRRPEGSFLVSMNLGSTVGPIPHAREEASPTNNTDAHCACGARADGYDARYGESICWDCARTRADGGVPAGVAATPRRLRATADGDLEEPSPEERQADALETIAEEMRYQNAVLSEIVSTLDVIHGDRSRSATAVHTAIDDHAITRDEQEGYR